MKNFPSINKSRASSTVTTIISTEISKTGITALGITALTMGFWAVTSMIAGAVNSSGPIDLAANLFKAING